MNAPGASSQELRRNTISKFLNSKKRWQANQQFVDIFWPIWLKEFFPTMNIAKKSHTSDELLKISKILFIYKDNVP